MEPKIIRYRTYQETKEGKKKPKNINLCLWLGVRIPFSSGILCYIISKFNVHLYYAILFLHVQRKCVDCAMCMSVLNERAINNQVEESLL